MKSITLVAAMTLVFIGCNATDFDNGKPIATDSYWLHNPFLHGLYNGVETINPADPLEWCPFVLWWNVPAVAATLQGVDVAIDLVARPLINYEARSVVNQTGYMPGYTLGNMLKVLMYVAPTLLFDAAKLGLYIASPYDHFGVEGACPLEKIRSTAVWSLRAMMVPAIIYAVKTGYSLVKGNEPLVK